MPDNWGYVLAAYSLAAAVFGGYWRHLARRAREVAALGPSAPRPGPPAGHRAAGPVRDGAPAGGSRP